MCITYLHTAEQRIGLPTPIWTQNQLATLYCTETLPIAQTWTQILICIQIPDHYCAHFWDGYLYPNRDPNSCPAMLINQYV